MKSLIFHLTFCAYQCASSWGCPHIVAVLQHPQRISTSYVIVSITDHPFLLRDPEGSPLKIAITVYYVKGIKVMTQHLSEHCNHFVHVPPLPHTHAPAMSCLPWHQATVHVLGMSIPQG